MKKVFRLSRGCPKIFRHHRLSGNTKDVFTFRGHVHPLDVDWRKIVKEQQDTMVIGLNAAKRLAANNDLYANFEIIIRKDN